MGIFVRREASPPGFHGIKFSASGNTLFTTQVIKGGLIRVDISAASPPFDTHVTNGHSLFHGHIRDGAAGVFIRVPDATVDPQNTNNVQYDVLRCDSLFQCTVDINFSHFQRIHGQRLACQHVTDLRGPNTQRNAAEGSVRRGVAVTTTNRHPRLGQPKLWTHHMHNAL